MNKHYYAEYCPYGIDTLSHGDTLMQFDTREERDEMVERLSFGYPCECKAVTVREVAHRYNFADFKDGDRCREVGDARTCKGRIFFEIGHRPGYIL